MSYLPPSSPPLHYPVPQHPIQFQQSEQHQHQHQQRRQGPHSRYAPQSQTGYGNSNGTSSSAGVYGNPMMSPSGHLQSSHLHAQHAMPMHNSMPHQPLHAGVQQQVPEMGHFHGNTGHSSMMGNMGAIGGNPSRNFSAPFNQILHDPAAQIGLEVGRNAFNYGQEYLHRNVEAYVSVGALRSYFQVSNSYVLAKLMLLVFPWTHKPWSRKLQRSDTGNGDVHSLPRDDVNSPDMYIPLTALTTWLVLYSVTRGLNGEFQPELLGLLSTKAFAVMAVEILFLKLSTYLLAASSKLLDFVAFAGYKFVPVTIVTAVTAFTSSRAIKWNVFAYCSAATSFFMLRSLRYDLLHNGTGPASSTVSGVHKQRQIYFLFFYAVACQIFLMWLLV